MKVKVNNIELELNSASAAQIADLLFYMAEEIPEARYVSEEYEELGLAPDIVLNGKKSPSYDGLCTVVSEVEKRTDIKGIVREFKASQNNWLTRKMRQDYGIKKFSKYREKLQQYLEKVGLRSEFKSAYLMDLPEGKEGYITLTAYRRIIKTPAEKWSKDLINWKWIEE